MSQMILPILGRPSKNPVKFSIVLNEEQKLAKERILRHPFNFVLGAAGSGKTLLATQVALDMLFSKRVEKIVITRPTVSTEDNGFLPGSLAEKLEPWLTPIRHNMKMLYRHGDKLDKMEKDGQIELMALTHFRGNTFSNTVCIVDEFQNLTKQQLTMVLGRLGKDSIMVLTGDEHQVDLKNPQDSAVNQLTKLNKSQFVNTEKLLDNHRHPALKEVLSILNSY
jgi:phosphate starvation-inducible PhoH-like protein